MPATIGYELEDGTVKSSCLYGSPEPYLAGKKLEQYWTDFSKVKELVELGHMSFLGSEIGQPHSFRLGAINYPEWCLFYGRDRGEDWNDVKPDIYPSIKEFTPENLCGYLFKDGKWVVYQTDCPQGESVGAAIERDYLKAKEEDDDSDEA